MAVRGLGDFLGSIDAMKGAVAVGLGPEMAAAAWIMARRAQQLAVFSSGIRSEQSERGARVIAKHPGARIHEFGGVITPKSARFLHFKVSGEEVFTKRVNMPARPYMRPAFDQTRDAVAAEFGVKIKGVLVAAA